MSLNEVRYPAIWKTFNHTIEPIKALRVTNYHCFSSQPKSFTSQWLTFLSVKEKKKTKKSSGWINSDSQNWPKTLQEIIYDGSVKKRNNSSPICVAQREREMLDLLKCAHCKANWLNECYSLFCLPGKPPLCAQDHPSGYSGIVWGSEVHRFLTLRASLLSSVE